MRPYLYAYANAQEMLMQCSWNAYACMQSQPGAPHIASLFSLTQGHRPALYKGLHATEARPVQKGGCRAGPDSRALRVELVEMLNVPGVAHRKAIFGLKADSARPSDSFHPVRAFPLRRQLVGILGGLNAPKNKVAFLETSGINFAAMVAAQSLLASSSCTAA